MLAALVGEGRRLGRSRDRSRRGLPHARSFVTQNCDCVTCSAIAAACQTIAATCSRMSATTSRKFCGDCGFSRQPAAFVLSLPTPTSATVKQVMPRPRPAATHGKSWPPKKLFVPLGMTSASYRFADYAKAKNRTVARSRRWKLDRQAHRQPHAQAPAGGASSTLNDLVRWMRLQLNEGKLDGRELISATALAETHTPQIVTGFNADQGRVVSYGLGWNVNVERGGKVFWKHSGEFALGMRTEVAILPAEELAIAVLSNACPTGVPEGLTESFYDLVLDGKLQRGTWVGIANRMLTKKSRRSWAKSENIAGPRRHRRPRLSTCVRGQVCE